MKRTSMLFIAAALAMGCGADGGTTNPVVDSGTNAGRDVPTGGSDTGTSSGTDAGTPTTDRGASTDRGTTTPRDSGSPPVGGECGQGLSDAICACGMNQTCQQNALNGSSQTCQQCLGAAQTSCCPAQFQEIQTCAMRNMCPDFACAQRMCAAEVMAAQTCFNMAQQNDTACQDSLAECFGTFPIQCSGGG